MNYIQRVIEASNKYENANTTLKKLYLKEYIELFNNIMKKVPGYKGSFGMGYPFYALDKNFEGKLPIVNEQLRYNYELSKSFSDYKKDRDLPLDFDIWKCEDCLREQIYNMPNLKSVCNRCPNMSKNLRPRKLINRLPDMDFAVIIEDEKMDEAKDIIKEQLFDYGIFPSDIDPLKTIDDVYEIAEDLSNDLTPRKLIPADVHLVSYDENLELQDKVVSVIDNAISEGEIPYIPILPLSLRMTWQYDDDACNYIHDFIYALTEYNFDERTLESLKKARRELISEYKVEELEEIALLTGADCVARRHETPALKQVFRKRMESWREE